VINLRDLQAVKVDFRNRTPVTSVHIGDPSLARHPHAGVVHGQVEGPKC